MNKEFVVRTKSEARRLSILAAAKAAFEELGFEQATMSDIAARVGGSKATLYSYFHSKEELFLELVRQSADQHIGLIQSVLDRCGGDSQGSLPPELASTLALLQPTEDLAQTLRTFGQRVLSTFYTPQKAAARRMIIAASNNPEIGRLFYERGPAQGMKFVADYFAAAIASGQLRPADPRVVAAHFRGLLEAEVFEPWLLNALPEPAAEAIEGIVNRAVEVFMAAYGLGAPAAADRT